MTTNAYLSITDDLIAELDDLANCGPDIMRLDASIMATLLAERAELKRDADLLRLYLPIIDEIDRRAGKQHCLEDQCDFTVTISYEDYAAIDAATRPEQP